MIEQLVEKAEAYKRGGEDMLELLNKIEAELGKILPEPFKFATDVVKFETDYRSLNLGPTLLYQGEASDNYVLPSEWSGAGGDCMDRGVHFLYATREMVETIARNLPCFIEALAEFLEKQTSENKEATKKLRAMVASIE